METIAQPTPQVITIFIPVFGRKTIKLRQLILTDDWVADCYALDEKYGVWFTTIQPAIALINCKYTLDI